MPSRWLILVKSDTKNGKKRRDGSEEERLRKEEDGGK
jgi:hypothetical protein